MNAPYDCSEPVDIADEPHHHLVIANEFVRAFAVDVPPRTRTLCHLHPNDYLLYVAAGATIVSAARDEEPKTLNYVDGECEFLRAGMVHVVDNLSDRAFRNVVVELGPKSGELRRGAHTSVVAGEVSTESLLKEDVGEVIAVDLAAGAEIEIAGPAVLSSPYGTVMIRELEEYEIPLDGLRKLMWVCAPRRIGVQNSARGSVRVIVVQLGILTT